MTRAIHYVRGAQYPANELVGRIKFVRVEEYLASGAVYSLCPRGYNNSNKAQRVWRRSIYYQQSTFTN